MEGPRPVVLSGPSGAGKSTLMKMLLRDYDGVFGFSVSRTFVLHPPFDSYPNILSGRKWDSSRPYLSLLSQPSLPLGHICHRTLVWVIVSQFVSKHRLFVIGLGVGYSRIPSMSSLVMVVRICVTQGCPLSPFFFLMAARKTTENKRTAIQLG